MKVFKIASKIKNNIKENDAMYVVCKSIMERNNPFFIKLIRGYFDRSYNSLSVIIDNSKFLTRSNEMAYAIKIACDSVTGMGMGALLRHTLIHLAFAEKYIKCKPVVIWGKESVYYEKELEHYSKNAFNYYFKPIGNEISDLDNKSYLLMSEVNAQRVNASGYNVSQSDIDYFAYLYKKYIILNENTNRYISDQINCIFDVRGRILGVHARGTDFNVGYSNHPIPITPELYVNKAKELFESGDYSRVFLATDDMDLLKAFVAEFGDLLVYYDDVFRTSGCSSPHRTQDDRPLHKYKLGLEVLRDIYTLSYCDSLLCGMSQVSFAARYVNIASGRQFEDIVVLSNGINEKSSHQARVMGKNFKERQKALNHDLRQNP